MTTTSSGYDAGPNSLGNALPNAGTNSVTDAGANSATNIRTNTGTADGPRFQGFVHRNSDSSVVKTDSGTTSASTDGEHSSGAKSQAGDSQATVSNLDDSALRGRFFHRGPVDDTEPSTDDGPDDNSDSEPIRDQNRGILRNRVIGARRRRDVIERPKDGLWQSAIALAMFTAITLLVVLSSGYCFVRQGRDPHREIEQADKPLLNQKEFF
jgi:hypothetical protein